MKCIAYVSKAPINERGIRLPTGMSDVVKVSRKFNPAAQITGIISYRQGHYFQVLEGPYRQIDELMLKIAADPRHEDIWVFINETISVRSFPNWGVSVFDFVDQGPFFKKFIEDNKQQIDSFTEEQKERIQVFVGLDEPDIESTKSYDGRSIRLLAWPDLNSVAQPQMIMNMCVKLTKKPYPFDKLVADGEFGTREQVTEIIKRFDGLGILTISEAEPQLEPELLTEPTTPAKKTNGFYGAIKRFLGMK